MPNEWEQALHLSEYMNGYLSGQTTPNTNTQTKATFPDATPYAFLPPRDPTPPPPPLDLRQWEPPQPLYQYFERDFLEGGAARAAEMTPSTSASSSSSNAMVITSAKTEVAMNSTLLRTRRSPSIDSWDGNWDKVDESDDHGSLTPPASIVVATFSAASSSSSTDVRSDLTVPTRAELYAERDDPSSGAEPWVFGEGQGIFVRLDGKFELSPRGLAGGWGLVGDVGLGSYGDVETKLGRIAISTDVAQDFDSFTNLNLCAPAVQLEIRRRVGQIPSHGLRFDELMTHLGIVYGYKAHFHGPDRTLFKRRFDEAIIAYPFVFPGYLLEHGRQAHFPILTPSAEKRVTSFVDMIVRYLHRWTYEREQPTIQHLLNLEDALLSPAVRRRVLGRNERETMTGDFWDTDALRMRDDRPSRRTTSSYAAEGFFYGQSYGGFNMDNDMRNTDMMVAGWTGQTPNVIMAEPPKALDSDDELEEGEIKE